MKAKTFAILGQRMPAILFLLTVLFAQNHSNAQLVDLLDKDNKALRQGRGLLNELNMMTKSYKALKEEINRNSSTYNKNVSVASGRNGAQTDNEENIPEKKLTRPKIQGNEFTNMVWEPANFFDGQLFPSAIISMAGYQGEVQGILESISRPVGFTLYSTKTNIPLKYEIECVDKRIFDK